MKTLTVIGKVLEVAAWSSILIIIGWFVSQHVSYGCMLNQCAFVIK